MSEKEFALSRDDKRRVQSLLRRQDKRSSRAMMILSTSWIASSYWTFLGFVTTAEETATANFVGTVHALIAAVVSAVVVAGCCALLLAFSGENSGEESDHE